MYELVFSRYVVLPFFSEDTSSLPWLTDPYAPFKPPESITPESAQTWRNINTFAAKCLGVGLQLGAYDHVMYALREGLEEDLSTVPEIRIAEAKIQVACIWIVHAAKPLLSWAIQNLGYTDVKVEDDANYIEGGPLYNGPQAMCLRRWGFWIERLQELGNEELGMGEGTRKTALDTAQTMKTIEGGMSRTLSE